VYESVFAKESKIRKIVRNIILTIPIINFRYAFSQGTRRKKHQTFLFGKCTTLLLSIKKQNDAL
jgi:glycopeptide antibiotics resistance protein